MPELIVETGANVANANSYTSVGFIRSYAADRGVEISFDDNEVAILGLKAMDYITANYGGSWIGEPEFEGQTTDWPRLVNGEHLMPSNILAKAQSIIAMQVHSGLNLLPTQTAAHLKARSIGPMRQEWFAPPPRVARIPIVDELFRSLTQLNSQPTVVRG